MKYVTEVFVCGLDPTGLSTGPMDNDLDPDDIDPRTPPGWLAITVRRVVVNPDYEVPKEAEDVLEDMLRDSALLPDQRAQAIGSLRPIAEMAAAAAAQNEEPRFIVQEVEMHLSPAYADRLFALDEEAFVDAGWIMPSEAQDATG